MAAYSVTARIEGVRPRRADRATTPDIGRASLFGDVSGPDVVEVVGRPLDVALAEWWLGVRESWAQTTFFLFDPESWR